MPGIPSEIIEYPFSGGLDEKTDPWLIEAPKVSSLSNAVFSKGGQIRKRRGFTGQPKTLQGGGSISAAARIGFRKNEQVLVDGDYLYSYAPSLAAQGAAPNIKIDQVPQLTATRAFVDNGPVTAWDADVGYVPISTGIGFEVYSWTNGTGAATGDVFVTVLDTQNGSTLYRSFQLTTGATYQQTFVVVVGTTAIVLYLDKPGGALKCRRLSLSSPAGWTVEQTLRSDLTFALGYCPFDAIGQDTQFVVAYQSTIAAPKLMLASFTSAGVAVTNAVLAGEAFAGNFSTISIGHGRVTTEHLLLVYSGTFGTKNAWVTSTAFAVTQVPVLITALYAALSAASVKLDASNAIVVMNMLLIGGPGITAAWSYKIPVDSSASATYHTTPNWIVSAKPFVLAGRAYALGFSSVGNTSASTIVCDLQADQNNNPPNHRPVCTIAPRITNSNTGSPRALLNGGMSNSVALSATSYLTIGTILRSNTIGGLMGMTRIALTNANTNRFQPLEIGEDLQLTGGTPMYYDGRTVAEMGFLLFPDSSAIIATPSTTGGLMIAGTYIYAFTYEITDASGQRHRSAVSVQKLVTVGGATTGSVAFTNIPNLTVTARQDNDNIGFPNVEIVVYRSVVGAGTLYRLTSENTPTALRNSTATQYTAFTDTFADSAAGNGQPLSTNGVVYTTGGVLDNVCPPSSTLGVVHRGRVWLAGCDDPRQIWFSKAFVTGDAVSFCDSFTFTIEDRNPITALGSLDDVLVIFTRSSIYIVSGDGPTDSGIGNNFSTPERVATDVGCIEPRSVVLTPDGLMFQGEQGIMLLDRSHAVSFIGSPVENTTSGKTISSAIVKPDQNQVVFSVQTSFVNGSLVKYDYVQRVWGGDGIYDIDQNLASMSVVSAARSAAGVYTIATAFGFVSTERPTNDALAYLDGNDTGTTHWITLFIQTAWIRFGALQRFQRARRFGLLMSRQTWHKLTVAVAFDYNSSQLQTEVITDAQFAAMQPSPQQPMFRVGSQNGASPRCQSVQLTIFDAPPTTLSVDSGQGALFTGLSFEICRKPGLRRTGATAKW